MIDSINYLARNVEFINFKYLKSIEVQINKYTVVDRQGNTGLGYSFVYEKVHFSYNRMYRCVLIKTNTHDMLSKRDITLQDKELYKSKLKPILNTVFQDNRIKLELERVDYYVDIPFEDETLKNTYLALYRYHMPNFAYTKIKNVYSSSVYRCSKRGQYNVNIYSRFEKTKNPDDKGILRVELQMKRPKIIKELKTNGIPREIDSYWCQDAMEDFYFNFYRKFFGIGKHMKYSKAKELINSSSYSKVWKKKLKKFLKELMAQVDYKEVVKSKKTFETYRDKLGALNINTLCIFESLEPLFQNVDGIDNLLDLARIVAKNKYFK